MKELGIQSIIRKKYRHSTSSKLARKEYPNLLNRDFSTDRINQKWVTDITYINTLSDGSCYLSSILDLLRDAPMIIAVLNPSMQRLRKNVFTQKQL